MNDSARGYTSDGVVFDEFALFDPKKLSWWRRLRWKFFWWRFKRRLKKQSYLVLGSIKNE